MVNPTTFVTLSDIRAALDQKRITKLVGPVNLDQLALELFLALPKKTIKAKVIYQQEQPKAETSQHAQLILSIINQKKGRMFAKRELTPESRTYQSLLKLTSFLEDAYDTFSKNAIELLEELEQDQETLPLFADFVRGCIDFLLLKTRKDWVIGNLVEDSSLELLSHFLTDWLDCLTDPYPDLTKRLIKCFYESFEIFRTLGGDYRSKAKFVGLAKLIRELEKEGEVPTNQDETICKLWMAAAKKSFDEMGNSSFHVALGLVSGRDANYGNTASIRFMEFINTLKT